MSRIQYTILVLMIVGIAGCSKKTTENEQPQQPPAVAESAPQAEAPQGAMEEKPPAAAPAASRPAAASRESSRTRTQAPADVTEAIKATPPPREPEPVQSVRRAMEEQAPPPVQQPRYVTLPAGTPIEVRLQDPLDSSVNQTGDTFRAILDQDIDVNGNIVAPRGSMLEGKVTSAVRSGRVQGRAAMSLQLVSLQVGDQSYPLQTGVLSFEAESSKKEDATKVGIGAGIGAVIGAIAGGGKGAAIGAAAGGGAGGATVLATRGKEVKFDPEHKLSFKLIQDTSVRLE